MKKLLLIIAAVMFAANAMAAWDDVHTPDAITLSLYHFDEDPSDSAVDSSGHGKNALLVNPNDPNFPAGGNFDPDLSWQPGKFGNAFTTTFLGAGNPANNYGALYLDGTCPQLQLIPEYTIEFWFKADDVGSDTYPHQIFSMGSGSGFVAYLEDGSGNNVIGFGGIKWPSGPEVRVLDTTHIPLSEWHHVAVQVDNIYYTTGIDLLYDVEIWIDGSLSSTHQINYMLDGSGYEAYIGSNVWGTGDHRSFRGQIDELRVSSLFRYGPGNPSYKPPVEEKDWYKLYDGSDPNTIVLLQLDETTGVTASDSAPAAGNNDGTLTVGFNSRSSLNVYAPEYNRSLDFSNSVNDVVMIADNDALEPEYQIAVEAWIYPRDLSSGWRPIVSKPFCWELTLSWNRLAGRVFNVHSSLWGQSVSAAGTVPLNQWSHVAMSYDAFWQPNIAGRENLADTEAANRVRIFINGIETTYDDFDTVSRSWFKVFSGRMYSNTAPVFVAYESGYPGNIWFDGFVDGVRISSVPRIFGIGQFPEINWIDRVGDDVEIEFFSAKDALYMMRSTDNLLGPWSKLAGVNGELPVTLFTDASAVNGNDIRFYRVEEFAPESMGYVDIASKTPTVDGFLTEWTDTDMIATRDNFFPYINGWYMPYAQANIYGAYNEGQAAYYFAFDVEELTSSDVLEFMLSDPSDTTIVDQIRFDKGGQIVFNCFEDTGIHPRWDTGAGDTYTYSDFVVDGGQLTEFSVGGSWKGELKVPYSFISATYSFPSSSQRTLHFNWETAAGTKLGTTNPKQAFWPIFGGAFDDPGVGVSRP